MTRFRVGIVVTHPIQYQVPLFRRLAARCIIEPIVFFLSEHGLTESFDAGYGRAIQYDVALVGGYEHRVVSNWSPAPGVSRPWGVVNPSLLRIIRRSEVDCVLVHGYSSVSAWLAYAAARGRGIPYLLRGESRPDLPGARSRSSLAAKHALLRPLVRGAGACLAIGQANRDFYLAYGARPEKIFFAPYSVDTERFAQSGERGRSRRGRMLEEIGLRPELPLVLFAGKLQPWKRPVDVLLATGSLDAPVNLVIIGDGPLRSQIENLATARPLVRTLGFVNQSQIGEWYGAAELFVLPSDREPWGLAVNEAMAAGAVPIVSDVVGCAPDLVTAGVGWVYPAGNVAALAGAITEACRPGALAERRLAAQLRSNEYGIGATAQGIEHAVVTILGR